MLNDNVVCLGEELREELEDLKQEIVETEMKRNTAEIAGRANMLKNMNNRTVENLTH